VKRRAINISDELYAELVAIKGLLEQQKKENISLGEVVAYLLDFYREKQGGRE